MNSELYTVAGASGDPTPAELSVPDPSPACAASILEGHIVISWLMPSGDQAADGRFALPPGCFAAKPINVVVEPMPEGLR